LIHYHHWHDRAVTLKYQKRGLLTPQAFDYLMNSDSAKSKEIYQDVSDREFRVHTFDRAHRAATADVKQISDQYLKDNGITKDNPMTASQAKQLIQEIITSDKKGISTYRELLREYEDGRGSEAERARAGFIRRMGREED
jgi:hypothetical protein